jgi:hypothetical protein
MSLPGRGRASRALKSDVYINIEELLEEQSTLGIGRNVSMATWMAFRMVWLGSMILDFIFMGIYEAYYVAHG